MESKHDSGYIFKARLVATGLPIELYPNEDGDIQLPYEGVIVTDTVELPPGVRLKGYPKPA